MVAPRTAVLLALPKAWTPGTNGPIRGAVMRIKAETPQDLEAYRGKVAGKILLLDDAREFKPLGEPKSPFDLGSFGDEPERYSREDLEQHRDVRVSATATGGPARRRAQALPDAGGAQRVHEKEKVLATISASPRNDGILGVLRRRLAGARQGRERPGDRDGGRALQRDPPPARPRPDRGARDRRRHPLPRGRLPGLQHRGRDPRHRQAGRDRAWRAPTSIPGTPAPARPTTAPAAPW